MGLTGGADVWLAGSVGFQVDFNWWVSISTKHYVWEIFAVLSQACCFFFTAGPV